MDTTAPSIPLSEMAEQVLRVLERARQPLTVFQVQRGLPRPYQSRTDELRQSLSEHVAQGRVHQFAPYRSKTPRFWTRDLDHYARQLIVQVLGHGSATCTALLRKVRVALQGLPEDRLRQVIDELLNDGQVRTLPPMPGGRATPLSTKGPSPRDYLGPMFRTFSSALHRVLNLLESEGVQRQQALHEAEQFWQQMIVREGPLSGPAVPPAAQTPISGQAPAAAPKPPEQSAAREPVTPPPEPSSPPDPERP